MAEDKTYTKDELDAAIAKEVDGLKSKVEELIASEKKWKAEARKASEVKPEDLAAAEDRADKAEAALAEAQKAAKEAEKARDKAVKDLETEQGFTQRLLIADGLKTALLENGVKDETFIDALTAKFASGAKVVVEGDERKALIGDKPLADAIKEFATSEAGKKFVSAPANAGGGARGGTQAKPDARTMTRLEYNALPQEQKAEIGMQMAKGEVKLSDAA